ncbi:MAG: hypothetical protein F4X00_03700 [Gemmatimonadetes bacterium]|nr:hypothetical protein [Gemmatimonadota bacterium]
MTPDQLLDRLAAVRIDRSHGGRAPHKPLMLLLALARVGLGPESRLIPYETADERFKELWEDFGRPGAPPRVHYPFGRLRNDDRLWEIPEESQLSTGRAADIRVSEARRLGITGGFRQEVHDLLWRHPELVSRAARQILSEHFPPSIHQDILDAVRLAAGPSSHGLDEPMPRRGRKVREYTPRDPRFRKRVLGQSVDNPRVAPRAVRGRAGKARREVNSRAIRPRSNAERCVGSSVCNPNMTFGNVLLTFREPEHRAQRGCIAARMQRGLVPRAA